MKRIVILSALSQNLKTLAEGVSASGSCVIRS